MAETTIGARTDLGRMEYDAFVQWFMENYPEFPPPPNDETIFNDASYSFWSQQGRPGFVSLGEMPREEATALLGGFEGRPPTREDPTPKGQGQVVIPGVLLALPDGTYVDYDMGLPVDPMTAERLLEEYWRTPDEDKDALTAYQREQLNLQREQLEFEKQAYGARQFAEPRSWIARWAYEHPMPTYDVSGFLPQEEIMGRISEATGKDAWSEYANQASKAQAMYSSGASSEEVAAAFPLVAGGTGFIPRAQEAQFAPQNIPAWEQQAFPQTEVVDPTTGQYSYIMEPGTWAKSYQSQLERQGKLEPQPSRHQLKKKAKAKEGPPAPGWLPQFAPGTVAGQGIGTTRAPVVTPSGQQWGRTPWSVRQGLAGYMDFLGGRGYRDMLEQMSMMQTRTPQQRRGWAPTKQRA